MLLGCVGDEPVREEGLGGFEGSRLGRLGFFLGGLVLLKERVHGLVVRFVDRISLFRILKNDFSTLSCLDRRICSCLVF